MSFIGLVVLAVVVAIFSVSFKNIKSEYGILLCVAVCILLFVYGVGKLSEILIAIETIKNYIGIDSVYIEIIVKIIGISYITEFASDVCKDCNYSAVANQVQIFGKLTVITISLPVVVTLFETINKIIS